ncbi:MAG: SMP-30/gluconolactonase/LRE family protein [Planctomycetaceae bacterium]|nr:SMP-30/gluconolactonase/LRE family protein [Planctomycetaceae bacterium]
MRLSLVSGLWAGLCSLCLASTLPAADLSELVGGELAKVVGDCKFTEGPAWHPDGYLLFSDIPNSRILKVQPDGSHSEWLTASGGVNGLMCDRAGNVFAAQGDLQRVVRLKSGADGTAEVAGVLAAEFDGKPFNKPNDLALDAEGGAYFTDPNYRQQPPSQPVQGCYYVSRSGKVTRVVADLPRPNGILVSQDGKTLYVANIEERKIMAYPIVATGQLSSPTVLFTGDETTDGNGPDGMSLDEHGNIYATYKQLVVVSPQGDLVGRVEIPEKPANCAFGGDDNRTLYITARTSLYKLPMKVAGIPLRERGPAGTVLAQADGDAADDSADGETEKVDLKGLTLNVPKAWEKQQPSSNLRLGQFSIPAADGDAEAAELAVFPPFGGTVRANVDRWIQQFEGQGRQMKASQGSCDQGKYVLVELTGTYKKPFGPPFLQQTQPAENYKMLGVILTSKDGGNYFLKLTGPKGTVAATADSFRKSFGGDAAKETEYEFGNE